MTTKNRSPKVNHQKLTSKNDQRKNDHHKLTTKNDQLTIKDDLKKLTT